MMVTLNLHTRTDFPNLARVSSMNIWDCSLVLCVFRTMFSCAFSMPFKITGLLPGLFQHSYLQAASQLSPLTIAVDICLDPLTQTKRDLYMTPNPIFFHIYVYKVQRYHLAGNLQVLILFHAIFFVNNPTCFVHVHSISIFQA